MQTQTQQLTMSRLSTITIICILMRSRVHQNKNYPQEPPHLFAGDNHEYLFIFDIDTYMHPLSIDMQNKHIQFHQYVNSCRIMSISYDIYTLYHMIINTNVIYYQNRMKRHVSVQKFRLLSIETQQQLCVTITLQQTHIELFFF